MARSPTPARYCESLYHHVVIVLMLQFLGCMPVRMESKEQGSSIVRECVKTCKVQS